MPPPRTPPPPRLPALLFDPIEKHASEEFGRWASVHDWTRFNRRFSDKAKEIQDGKPGGFTLIAHNAIKLVIDYLVTNNTIPATAKDEFQAICDQVTAKQAEEKRQAAAADAKKKADTAATTEETKIRGAFTKVTGAVSAVLGNAAIAQYPMYQRVLQERWDEIVAYFATPTELEDFYLALTGMDDKLDGFIKSLLMEKDGNRRIESARRAIPNL